MTDNCFLSFNLLLSLNHETTDKLLYFRHIWVSSWRQSWHSYSSPFSSYPGRWQWTTATCPTSAASGWLRTALCVLGMTVTLSCGAMTMRGNSHTSISWTRRRRRLAEGSGGKNFTLLFSSLTQTLRLCEVVVTSLPDNFTCFILSTFRLESSSLPWKLKRTRAYCSQYIGQLNFLPNEVVRKRTFIIIRLWVIQAYSRVHTCVWALDWPQSVLILVHRWIWVQCRWKEGVEQSISVVYIVHARSPFPAQTCDKLQRFVHALNSKPVCEYWVSVIHCALLLEGMKWVCCPLNGKLCAM